MFFPLFVIGPIGSRDAKEILNDGDTSINFILHLSDFIIERKLEYVKNEKNPDLLGVAVYLQSVKDFGDQFKMASKKYNTNGKLSFFTSYMQEAYWFLDVEEKQIKKIEEGPKKGYYEMYIPADKYVSCIITYSDN